MCVDFRAINSITKKDMYPLPRIDEIIDSLADGTIFSSLDATNGYYQLEIEEEDKQKTAFRWKSGFYEFNRMPFGLCNAPATFQRCIDIILKDVNGIFVAPYLDDIIIYSKSVEEHAKHLECVLDKLKNAGLVLNKNKCKFFQEEIKILGVKISKGIVKPDEEKVEAIKKFRKPNNIKELRSFLGLANYCRGFIPRLAEIEAPLNKILKGETKRSVKKIVWEADAEEAFIKIKKSLSNETLRFQPNFQKEFILTTDASDTAIGGILSQIDENGIYKMVYAYSKTMDEPQKNYGITDKELLAVIKSTEHFRKYLLGREFLLRTDHKALEHLIEAKNPTSRMLRWALKLQEYQYRVEYIKGEENGADGLSRYCGSDEKMINVVKCDNEKNEILKEYHEEAGHASENNMKFLMKGKHKWPGIMKDIENYVKRCEICLTAGNERSNTKNKYIEINSQNELWECDLIGRIPMKDGTSRFIFTAIDHYSKWMEAKIIKSKDQESVSECIHELIIKKHGVPKIILSDNGKEFKNDKCRNLSIKYGFEWKFASPYHHKTMGVIERANQTLWQKIRKMSEFGKTKWTNKIERAVYAVNISFNRSIGTSPYILLKGETPILNGDVKRGIRSHKVDVRKIKEKIEMIRNNYKKEIEKGKKTISYDLELGTRVLIFDSTPGDKMKAKWKKGFWITKKLIPDAYLVSNGKRNYHLNKSRIKRDLNIAEGDVVMRHHD